MGSGSLLWFFGSGTSLCPAREPLLYRAQRQKRQASGGDPFPAGMREVGKVQDALVLSHYGIFSLKYCAVQTHTACRFAEKTRFFRSLWAGQRGAAASCFAFFKGKTL